MARRYLERIHIIKSAEIARKHKNIYERKNYSEQSQRFLEDARKLEEGGWLGKAAALYRAGGREKKARILYLKVANQRYDEHNYMAAADYYNKAHKFEKAKEALDKIVGEDRNKPVWVLAHNSIKE